MSEDLFPEEIYVSPGGAWNRFLIPPVLEARIYYSEVSKAREVQRAEIEAVVEVLGHIVSVYNDLLESGHESPGEEAIKMASVSLDKLIKKVSVTS